MSYRLASIGLAALLAASAPEFANSANFATFTVTPDTITSFVYPDDAAINRTVTVKNTTKAAEVIDFTPQFGSYAPICNPQPPTLYLAAGASGTVECQISMQGAGVTIAPGQTITVPLSLNFLDTTNAVSGSVNLNTTDAGVVLPANATLTGTVTDQVSGKPVGGTQVSIASAEGLHSYSLITNSAGKFSTPIITHKRTYVGNWVEQIIAVTANGYDNQQSLAIVQQGQKVNLSLPLTRTNSLKYKVIQQYNAGLPVGRGAISANGQYVATVPFADTSGGNFQLDKAELDFFNTQTGALLWKKEVKTFLPSVDVSSDGQYVLICNPGPDPDAHWDNLPGFIAYNQAGNVYRQYNIPGAGPMTGCSDAHFSHDGSLIAFGTLTGNVGLYNVASQQVLWTGFLGGMIRAIAFSADDSTVFFSSGDNSLYALRQTNGSQLWVHYIHGWAHSLPMSANLIEGIGKGGVSLSVLNQSNAKVAWQYGKLFTSDGGAFSPSGNALTIADNEPSLGYAYFGAKGLPQWSISGGATATTFSTDGNYVGVLAFLGRPQGSQDDVRLYSTTGTLLWHYLITKTASWTNAEAGVIFVSNDAQTITVGSPESGMVYIFQSMN